MTDLFRFHHPFVMDSEKTDFFIRVKELRPSLSDLIEIKQILGGDLTKEKYNAAYDKLSEVIQTMEKLLHER